MTCAKLWNKYIKLNIQYVPFMSSLFLCLPSSGSAEQWPHEKNKYEGSIPKLLSTLVQASWSSTANSVLSLRAWKERNLEDNVT